MKNTIAQNSIERLNYWQQLPRNIYCVGSLMELIQGFGMVWLMIEKAPWIGFLSGFGIVLGVLVLKPHYEGDTLRDSWKLSCFVHSLVLIMMQFLLVATGPIL